MMSTVRYRPMTQSSASLGGTRVDTGLLASQLWARFGRYLRPNGIWLALHRAIGWHSCFGTVPEKPKYSIATCLKPCRADVAFEKEPGA